jgi:hypothetical protein
MEQKPTTLLEGLRRDNMYQLGEPAAAPATQQNEYAFDVVLAAALRVKASDEADARLQLKGALHCADTNFGAWRSGDPIIGEVSLRGTPSLYEVNGETIEHPAPAPSATVYECPDCDWTGTRDEMNGLCHLHHIDEHISVGELVPAGVCPDPDCRAMIEANNADVADYVVENVATIMRARGWTVIEPPAPHADVEKADGVLVAIADLPRDTVIDLLDEIDGVGCRDEDDEDDLKAELKAHYLANRIDGQEIIDRS